MVFVIDGQSSGISGNMLVGALIDLGVPELKVKKIMEDISSYFGELEINIQKVSKNGISSTFLEVQSNDYSSITYEELMKKLDSIDSIPEEVLNFSKKVFKRIAVSESKVHSESLNKVHFHEVGAADAIADVIGAVYCYFYLKMNEDMVFGLPLAVGGGTVKTQHGTLPVPAPSTLDILEGAICIGGPVNAELTTPTGAALYQEMVDEVVEFLPVMNLIKYSYGAGKMEFDHPNVLRIIKGDTPLKSDKIHLLETNIDHLNGEVMGSLFDKLLLEGALDVSVSPLIMKKNRPGFLLSVIVKSSDADKLIRLIHTETGTLGIRTIPNVHRNIIDRKIVPFTVDIDGEHSVNFKVSYLGSKVISQRIEYDDALRVSKKTGIPLRDVIRIAEESFGVDDE